MGSLVGLGAEAEPDARAAGAGRGVDADSAGGQRDGVAQDGGGVPGRGQGVAVAGGVEADHGVEVDDAACLVFGDLDVADAQVGAQPLAGDPGEPGQVPGQVGGEPLEQRRPRGG